VRYRLGDLAAWDPEPCPCGRAMPVVREVVGRIEDLVIGADGRGMSCFHNVFDEHSRVREGQIIQETLDRIRVKVVPAEGFGPSEEAEIARRVCESMRSSLDVVVERVEQIPRTHAGKFVFVISHVRHRDGTAPERTGLATEAP
jgi:phenylacetate-CoA ligase